jgi:hypothetical protein
MEVQPLQVTVVRGQLHLYLVPLLLMLAVVEVHHRAVELLAQAV